MTTIIPWRTKEWMDWYRVAYTELRQFTKTISEGNNSQAAALGLANECSDCQNREREALNLLIKYDDHRA